MGGCGTEAEESGAEAEESQTMQKRDPTAGKQDGCDHCEFDRVVTPEADEETASEGASMAAGVDIGSCRVKQLDGAAATQDSSLLYDKIRGVPIPTRAQFIISDVRNQQTGDDPGVGGVSDADDAVTHRNYGYNTNFPVIMRAPTYDEQEPAPAEGAEESVASLAEELESCLFGLRHRRGEMSDKERAWCKSMSDKSQAHSIDTTMVDNGEDLHMRTRIQRSGHPEQGRDGPTPHEACQGEIRCCRYVPPIHGVRLVENKITSQQGDEVAETRELERAHIQVNM